MAPSDSRSVNRCGHGHLACKFPINVTVPFRMLLGLFVDDGALALAIIVVVLVSWTLSTLLLDMPIVAGAVLLIGCLGALLPM
jgi:hypothetical protein